MLQKTCFLKCQLIAKWLQLLSSFFIFATMETSATEGKILCPSLFPAKKCKSQSLLFTAATFRIKASSLSLVPSASLGQTDRPTNQTLGVFTRPLPGPASTLVSPGLNRRNIVTESFGWKRPLRSSPTVSLTLPSPALNHIPTEHWKCLGFKGKVPEAPSQGLNTFWVACMSLKSEMNH